MEERVPVTVGTVSVSVTDQLIDDLLVAAFEGGSNYWIVDIDGEPGAYDKSPYHSEQVAFHNLALRILVDNEEDEPTPYILTRRKMILGIGAYANLPYGKAPAQLAEDNDATEADCVLQLALLGDVVFG